MNDLFTIAKRIQALAENGLVFCTNTFDIERYQELEFLSAKILEIISDQPIEKIQMFIRDNNGYKTPKVDVRAVIFNDKNEILMVHEKSDGNWSLPGGWADVGYSPKEVAIKESKEEAGIDVEVIKLLAVFDKSKHFHSQELSYVYKIFFMCKMLNQEFKAGNETLGSGFFKKDNLPPLSKHRNTESQILTMFEFQEGLRNEPLFD